MSDYGLITIVTFALGGIIAITPVAIGMAHKKF
jgi:VIT1/CCC1 family predicted Fe2+/Mn2+ transporter